MSKTLKERLCACHGFYDAPKNGKKICLKEYETDSLAEDLSAFFDRMVNVERIKVGSWQTNDKLISERHRSSQNI